MTGITENVIKGGYPDNLLRITSSDDLPHNLLQRYMWRRVTCRLARIAYRENNRGRWWEGASCRRVWDIEAHGETTKRIAY